MNRRTLASLINPLGWVVSDHYVNGTVRVIRGGGSGCSVEEMMDTLRRFDVALQGDQSFFHDRLYIRLPSP